MFSVSGNFVNFAEIERQTMILSMTGFGRGKATAAGRQINVELKSLNSKQLDLVVKLPFRYRCLEGTLRNEIARDAVRGKIDVLVTVEQNGEEGASIFNIETLKRYKAEIEQLDRSLGIAEPTDWHQVLLRMPDAMKTEDEDLTKEEERAFNEAAAEALRQMADFRKEEGRKLYSFFVSKIKNIEELLAEVAPHEESRVGKIKSRINEQLEALKNVDVDYGRFEQELIYYIEKLDISEEKQRLKSHLDYFLQTMGGADSAPEAVGKKLGFISQEMGREINTLGSKSNNAEMQIIVVKMKDELEQIKEQVLNVL